MYNSSRWRRWRSLNTTTWSRHSLRIEPISLSAQLSVEQDRARDGLQTARGRAEKLAASRRTQPVAKTRSRCDIQRRDRGHRQADRPSAHNRRRLTGPGRHQKLAIARQIACADSPGRAGQIIRPEAGSLALTETR